MVISCVRWGKAINLAAGCKVDHDRYDVEETI